MVLTAIAKRERTIMIDRGKSRRRAARSSCASNDEQKSTYGTVLMQKLEVAVKNSFDVAPPGPVIFAKPTKEQKNYCEKI